jgi:hypothetical protein
VLLSKSATSATRQLKLTDRLPFIGMGFLSPKTVAVRTPTGPKRQRRNQCSVLYAANPAVGPQDPRCQKWKMAAWVSTRRSAWASGSLVYIVPVMSVGHM